MMPFSTLQAPKLNISKAFQCLMLGVLVMDLGGLFIRKTRVSILSLESFSSPQTISFEVHQSLPFYVRNLTISDLDVCQRGLLSSKHRPALAIWCMTHANAKHFVHDASPYIGLLLTF